MKFPAQNRSPRLSACTPHGCNGRCNQGRHRVARPIQTVEQEHPWLWWLYAAAAAAAFVMSSCSDRRHQQPDASIDPPACAASSCV